jgi:hypothetical protein
MFFMLITISFVAACYIAPAYIPLFNRLENDLADWSTLDYSLLKALLLLSILLFSYHRYKQSKWRQRKIFFTQRSGRRNLRLPKED